MHVASGCLVTGVWWGVCVGGGACVGVYVSVTLSIVNEKNNLIRQMFFCAHLHFKFVPKHTGAIQMQERWIHPY